VIGVQISIDHRCCSPCVAGFHVRKRVGLSQCYYKFFLTPPDKFSWKITLICHDLLPQLTHTPTRTYCKMPRYEDSVLDIAGMRATVLCNLVLKARAHSSTNISDQQMRTSSTGTGTMAIPFSSSLLLQRRTMISIQRRTRERLVSSVPCQGRFYRWLTSPPHTNIPLGLAILGSGSADEKNHATGG